MKAIYWEIMSYKIPIAHRKPCENSVLQIHILPIPFQNGRVVAILDFFGFVDFFRIVNQVCLAISISIFMHVLCVAMGNSLYMLSNVTFKMTT